MKLYQMPEQERKRIGKLGREHLLKNYNPISWLPLWDQILTQIQETKGSWETRKHKLFSVEEV